MANQEAYRAIVMYPVGEANTRLNGESGPCLLRMADGSHRFGYRTEDGVWYEDGGGQLDPVEFGVL